MNIRKLLGITKKGDRPKEQELNINELSEEEKTVCLSNQISEGDAFYLKKLTGNKIEPFVDKRFDVELGSTIYSACKHIIAQQLVVAHRDHFLKKNMYLFNSGFDEQLKARLTITKVTTDPYKLMEIMKTNGVNYDLETQDIIVKLKEWDKRYGIIIVGAGFDFCEVYLLSKNVNYNELAQEVYTFCPDVIDQGTETVEEYAEVVEESNIVYLWWD